MNILEAIILGIIQGLTEFLPISSSGHLEIGKVLLGIKVEESIIFTIVVHGATVCSTIVVFYKELGKLSKDFFMLKWNDSTIYIVKLILSCIPVLIVGLVFEKQVEQLFTGNLILVGSMLLITALLLGFTNYAKSKEKTISFLDSLIIGVAQAFAVIPGISRSGATISTGLFLKNKREEVAKFSFLMVLIPIIGENILLLFSGEMANNQMDLLPLVVGFIAAFVSGWVACKWMIKIVKKSKLVYFAIYCVVIGSLSVFFGLKFVL